MTPMYEIKTSCKIQYNKHNMYLLYYITSIKIQHLHHYGFYQQTVSEVSVIISSADSL